MTNNLATATKYVPPAAQTMTALTKMEEYLDTGKTYEAIRKIIIDAEHVKKLYAEVDEVREKAEWVILRGKQRISEELKDVPKAARGLSKLRTDAKLRKPGVAATGVQKDQRSRLRKLLKVSKTQLRDFAETIWEKGKEATVGAVLHELKNEELKDKRQAYKDRAERGAPTATLEELIAAGKTFPVIYADPPWTFRTFSDRGKERSPERHYEVMTLDDIKAQRLDKKQKIERPIDHLAAKDCVLFMWGVWPEIQGTLDVIKAWGFEYKTCGFLWVKQNKSGEGLFTGMGYWTRSNTEYCLLATRGKPQRMAKDVHQVIMERVGEHSAKPDETRFRIQELFTGDYLELFARPSEEDCEKWPGWTFWGNEFELSAEAAK